MSNAMFPGAEHELQAALEKAGAAAAKHKPKKTSPTERSLRELKKFGWCAQVVERWNAYARVRQDLFGVIDLVAIVPAGGASPGAILGIQATTQSNAGARRLKILAEPKARAWVEAGGRLELWSWAQRGERGTRKLWTLKREEFVSASWRGDADAA